MGTAEYKSNPGPPDYKSSVLTTRQRCLKVTDFENSLYAFGQSEQIVSSMYNNKHLLDNVFVISRMIKVKVGLSAKAEG